jgi:tetratricopeptide (TPR) repeat protein
MFQAVYYFESDSLDLALNGDGNHLGLLDIIDEYGGTDAANLAEYYAGTAYLLKGNYNTAIEYLGSFSSGDILIQGRAYSLTGDAYMELGNYGKAAEFYNKAANYKPNQHFTPQYLMKAALAYEKLNDYPTAKEMYDRIVEEFFNSSEFQDAKKQSARMQALISS